MEDFISTGKLGGAVGYFSLQFVPTCAQGLLQFPLFGNISVRAKPARYLSVCVKDGKGARQEPSVFTGLTSQRKGIVPWFASSECDLYAFDNSVHFIWMMDLLP